MSTPLHLLAPLGVALVLSTAGLAACGSNSDNSSSNSSSSGGGVSAACSLDNPPTSTAKGRPGGDPGKASGKVGAILPDTTSSTRYTLYDAPLLTKSLKAAGITPDVQNAQGDKNKFASIAQNMIGEGVKVLIIDSIDAASGAGVEKQAGNAGVQVIESRISHLAYAPEIAAAMLRRQQAGAVIAARQRIVEGAVGMVEHALQMLSEQQIVELDEERKAAMVSNLLVVLCSDRGAQPVVNSGSLYG